MPWPMANDDSVDDGTVGPGPGCRLLQVLLRVQRCCVGEHEGAWSDGQAFTSDPEGEEGPAATGR